MAGQPGFFDADERLRGLSASGDPLERLRAVVDFELFRPELEAALARADRRRGGRPPYDAVMMLRILVLQTLYTLSDDQTEYQLRDRLSFMRFVGLALHEPVPDAKTIWLFREQLTRRGTLAAGGAPDRGARDDTGAPTRAYLVGPFDSDALAAGWGEVCWQVMDLAVPEVTVVSVEDASNDARMRAAGRQRRRWARTGRIRSASRRPFSVNGMSVVPVCWPLRLHAVSPCLNANKYTVDFLLTQTLSASVERTAPDVAACPHVQPVISGMSSPCREMYSLCLMSSSRTACLA
jgi:hypothetical protein